MLRTAFYPGSRGEALRVAFAGVAIGAVSCLAVRYSAAIAIAAVSLPVLCYAYCVPSAWIRLLLVTAALAPPLPLALGDSGPHVAILFAAVGVCAAVVRPAEWELRFSFLNTALLCWWATLALSIGPALVWSGPRIAAGSAARIALAGIALLVFFAASQGPDRVTDARTRRTVQVLFAVAVGAAAFACLDFRFQFPAPAGYGAQYVWLDSGVYRRAQGLFYEASTLGNFCAFFLLMAAVAFVGPAEQRIVPRKWLGAGAVILSAALFASYSRASLLNVAVGTAVLAALEWRRWFRIRKLALVAGLAALTMVVLWRAAPEFAASYWGRLMFSLSDLGARPDRVLSGRLASWETLAGFAGDHPGQVLVGIGYKTLAYTEHLGQPVIADNAYVSALIETGLLGLCALIALNAAILAAAWRAAKGSNAFFGRWMLCFWAGEMVQMLSGDILTYWRVLPFYFWVLAHVARSSSDAHPGA